MERYVLSAECNSRACDGDSIMRVLRDMLVLAGPMMALVWLAYGLWLVMPAVRRWLIVMRARWQLRGLDRVVAKWAHPANRLATPPGWSRPGSRPRPGT
jgi:hypothetical protein